MNSKKNLIPIKEVLKNIINNIEELECQIEIKDK